MPLVETPADSTPHVPPALAHIATALSPILVGAAPMLPPPFNAVAFVLGFICAFLGGLSLPAPNFVASRPKVSAALVPVLGTAATFIGALSDKTTGITHVGVVLAGLVLAWLAGKVTPAPQAP